MKSSIIHGIVYQQPLLNEDFGSSSENTARASAGEPLPTLSDLSTCVQDVASLSALNTNVIRSYAIDPAQNHSTCMHSLATANIYVLIDLTAPGYTIGGHKPQWTEALYNRYTAVIDAMQGYNNTFGFLVGDDIAGSPSTISPFIRAAVRDMKNYIADNDYRNIPVGYAASDNGSAHGIAQYLVCGERSTAIDFLGINNREWCEYDDYNTSGYRALTSAYSLYPVPTFLAEYGCVSSDSGSTEDFSEIDYLYGKMTPVMSGGFYYGYFSVNVSTSYGKRERLRAWQSGTDENLGLVTTSGQENLNADNSTRFGSYAAAMRQLPDIFNYPSNYISGYAFPNPFPTSCPKDAVDRLPPVPVSIASNATSTRGSPRPAIAPGSPHLSRATTAGVAAGCVLAASFLVMASCLVIHRKRRLKEKGKKRGSAHAEPWSKGELPAEDVDNEARGLGPHMADSTGIAEVEGAQRLPEVEGRNIALEIEAESIEIFEAPADLSALPELMATEVPERRHQ